LLSSHYSEIVNTASPQTSTQTEAVVGVPPVHDHPGASPEQSSKHFEVGSLSPSSQTSEETLLPSPQKDVQTEGEPVQDQPDSTTHKLSHPSNEVIDPSSHYSEPVLTPSPQISVQVEAVVELPPIHVHPDTGPVHKALHLSKLDTSPSSQISPVIRRPSPHIGIQSEGETVLSQTHPVST